MTKQYKFYFLWTFLYAKKKMCLSVNWEKRITAVFSFLYETRLENVPFFNENACPSSLLESYKKSNFATVLRIRKLNGRKRLEKDKSFLTPCK